MNTTTKHMENKQTAVDLMFQRAISVLPMGSIDARRRLEETYQQAKAMEKEQKKFMFDCGRQYQLTGEGTFTEVYNETYKGGQQ